MIVCQKHRVFLNDGDNLNFLLVIVGLVEGYASEKKGLDESVRSLEDSKELLIVQLEHAKARLHELEESRDDMEAREEELQRQRLVLEDSFGIEEQGKFFCHLTNILLLLGSLSMVAPGMIPTYCEILHSTLKAVGTMFLL